MNTHAPAALRRGLPAVSVPLTCVRTAATVVLASPKDQRPAHGERIWVFNHMLNNQVVYSLKPVLDSNKAFRQLPFHGKKTVPAKLRKDYWQPMAVICFRRGWGRGAIGRSVFQRLREYRRLHELSWGNELLRHTKKERGAKLNDQRANSIADIAAVLSGVGPGNLVAEANAKPRVRWHASKKEEVAKRGSKRLYKATVFWANREDRKYARKWTGNVSHERMKVVLGAQYWHEPEPDRGELMVVRPQAAQEAEAVTEGEVEGERETGKSAAAEVGVEGEAQATQEGAVTQTTATTTYEPEQAPAETATTQAKTGGEGATTPADGTAVPQKGETMSEGGVKPEETKPEPEPEAVAILEEEDPEWDLWSPEEGVSDAVDEAYARKEKEDSEAANKVAGELAAPAEGEGEGEAATAEGKDGEAAKDAEAKDVEPKDAKPKGENADSKSVDSKNVDSKTEEAPRPVEPRPKKTQTDETRPDEIRSDKKAP